MEEVLKCPQCQNPYDLHQRLCWRVCGIDYGTKKSYYTGYGSDGGYSYEEKDYDKPLCGSLKQMCSACVFEGKANCPCKKKMSKIVSIKQFNQHDRLGEWSKNLDVLEKLQKIRANMKEENKINHNSKEKAQI